VLRHESWTSIRGESASAQFARSRPSPILVVAQVAAALVLLVGAGLLLNSFVRLAHRDLGFETNNVMTFRLSLPPNRYPTAAQHAAFWGRLIEALANLPGSEDAAAGTALPFQGRGIGFGPVSIARRVVDNSPLAFALVTPGYFRALRVPVLNGREFTSADGGGAPIAAVVSQSFATHYFQSTNPLGQEVQAVDAPPARIVGVVPDAARSLGMLPTPSYPEIYFSAVQLPSAQPRWRTNSTTIAVRTTGDPTKVIPGIRRTVATLDPGLPIYDMTSVRQRLSEALAESRVYSIGAIAFGATAALLAVIGLYGVMSYTVASRTQEWGIRMALGADAREIIRHVVGSGFRLTTAGVLFGMAGAWLASRSLRTMLFGVRPNDPATLLGVAMLFFVVAVVACYVPARRASRVDPMVALRHE
jgi:putative ABC transport system permease protein